MSRSNNQLKNILPPIVWGILATVGFYALIFSGTPQRLLLQVIDLGESDPLTRYFASHQVEYITTTLFFIGLAALILKAIDVLRQSTQSVLEPVPDGGQQVSESERLLSGLSKLPSHVQNSYLVRRIREALLYVRRKCSAADLDEQLRYLSDVDSARMHSGYAFVRIIIWSIPILGFLGTVIGIAMAVANLNPEGLEESMGTVTKALGVAFDTTTLALSLSIVLMFAQFMTDHAETQLLENVDARVNAELVGRFQQLGTDSDPHVTSLHKMLQTVVQGTEQLVERQAELWQKTIDAAHKQWSQLTDKSQTQMEASLSGALSSSIIQHAEMLEATIGKFTKVNHKHWDQIAQATDHSTQALIAQQGELVKQSDVLLQIVDATGHVQQLEEVLNRNLSALAGSKNFEETVISLSAAIQLLTTRLGPAPGDVMRVELDGKSQSGQAA